MVYVDFFNSGSDGTCTCRPTEADNVIVKRFTVMVARVCLWVCEDGG